MRTPPYLLLLGAMALAAGCSTAGNAAHNGQDYVVNSQRTMFYSFGPSQTTGPDFALYNGARVKMLQYAFGFSRIKVESGGQTGYVSTDDLAPAPAPVASATPAVHRHRERAPTQEELNNVPLPEFPEAKPPPNAPAFHY